MKSSPCGCPTSEVLSFLNLDTPVLIRMESGGNYSISDWDRPFTDLELEAIEAAFQSAATPSTTSSSSSSPIKRRRHLPTPNDDSLLVRRRLPGSINSAHLSSLLPCRNKRFFNPYHHPSYPGKRPSFYSLIIFSRSLDFLCGFPEILLVKGNRDSGLVSSKAF